MNTKYIRELEVVTDKLVFLRQYVNSLEILLVMTANGIKRPLSNCLNQINIFDSEKPSNKEDLKQIVDNLKLSVLELDSFTKELRIFIRDMKK
ncbi:MAG: hypothetical protein V4549_14370 [Bacteroidota bacterium]